MNQILLLNRLKKIKSSLQIGAMLSESSKNGHINLGAIPGVLQNAKDSLAIIEQCIAELEEEVEILDVEEKKDDAENNA